MTVKRKLTEFEEFLKVIQIKSTPTNLTSVIEDLEKGVDKTSAAMYESSSPTDWDFAASSWFACELLLFSYRWHQ